MLFFTDILRLRIHTNRNALTIEREIQKSKIIHRITCANLPILCLRCKLLTTPKSTVSNRKRLCVQQSILLTYYYCVAENFQYFSYEFIFRRLYARNTLLL